MKQFVLIHRDNGNWRNEAGETFDIHPVEDGVTLATNKPTAKAESLEDLVKEHGLKQVEKE